MSTKDEVRPIYSELQGYLSQTPPDSKNILTLNEKSAWGLLNSAIDELDQITSKDYGRFRIAPMAGQFGSFVRMFEYRARLGGLISRLHGEYFSDEQPPFSGMPSTVIQQTQNQNQTQSISILLEIQEKIISEIPKHEEGSKERTFLEKVKSILPSIKTVTDIISSILKIGSELGLSASDMHKLLY